MRKNQRLQRVGIDLQTKLYYLWYDFSDLIIIHTEKDLILRIVTLSLSNNTKFSEKILVEFIPIIQNKLI